jgi:hypothetical protein
MDMIHHRMTNGENSRFIQKCTLIHATQMFLDYIEFYRSYLEMWWRGGTTTHLLYIAQKYGGVMNTYFNVLIVRYSIHHEENWYLSIMTLNAM